MNPRIKKIGRNILFLLSIPGIIGAFVFANSNKQDEKCKGIHITIENTELSFVTEKNILDIIEAQGIEVDKTVINQIKANKLENKIKENQWVKDANIYITANHEINVKVKQRKPFARIQYEDNSDYAYYLDENGNPMQMSQQYIANVPVITTPKLGYTTEDIQAKKDVVVLAKYISADNFWNTMITQINMNENHEIDLVPALGEHTILLGSVNDLDSKMKRLLAFYQSGMNTIDWNKYNEIDLRFARQVVARNTKIVAFPPKKLPKETEDLTSGIASTQTLKEKH